MRHIFALLAESAANEEKLMHLEHAEDHIVNAGSAGYKHAVNTLSAVHKTLTGQKGGASITEKYDGCISGDTEILMDDGTYKTIEQITTEWSVASPCKVIGWDFENNSHTSAKVIDKNVNIGEKDWVIVETEQGTITCTHDHEFFVEEKGWVQASLLNQDDTLKSI